MKKRFDKEKKPVDWNGLMMGKIPPQAKELEEAVLGAIMLERNAFSEVSQMLRPEHFYVEAHKLVFKAFQNLERKAWACDLLTVVDELRSMGELDNVGGSYAVTKLTNAVVSSANIITHSRIIIQKYIHRELIKVSAQTLSEAHDEGNDVFDMLDNANNIFYKINYEIENIHTMPLDVMAVRYIQRREALHSKEGNLLYTGFSEWDKLNGPLFRGGIYFIAGRPGMGKTAFVVEMIKKMATKVDVGFINLEMTNDQIVQRLISNMQEINNYEFKKPPEEAPEWLNEKIYAGMQNFINLKLQIESKSGITVEQIIAKLKYWKYKHNIQVAVIDFLQIIGYSEERMRYHTDLENMNYTLDRISQAAKELDIPIILLSQLNRDLYKRGGNKEPDLADLKGSGKIEEIAYQISFLHRPEYYEILVDETGESTKGLCYQIIKKHRDGELGKIKHRFEGQYSRFSNWDMPRFNAPASFDKDLPF